MSDRQLMAALREANPEKYGAVTLPPKPSRQEQPPKPSGPSDDVVTPQTEKEDRALSEVMRTAGFSIGSDRKQINSDVKKMVCGALGVKNDEIAYRLLAQIRAAMKLTGPSDPEFIEITAAIAMMQEIKPENVIQAMLASQIVGVHHAVMAFLNRATHSTQTFEGADANVLRATRLGRLYIEQLEAMAKLKGKIGEQKVTVEHVHVHEGGQAIVGAVMTPKADEGGGG